MTIMKYQTSKTTSSSMQHEQFLYIVSATWIINYAPHSQQLITQITHCRTRSAVCNLPHLSSTYRILWETLHKYMCLDSERNLDLKTDMLPQTLSHILIQGGTHLHNQIRGTHLHNQHKAQEGQASFLLQAFLTMVTQLRAKRKLLQLVLENYANAQRYIHYSVTRIDQGSYISLFRITCLR